ncbi:hypothetical protein DICSQDRAFT_152538 [Dichomitus squalens LYAD-421 SS1]|uniref:uncharacterized protein n=1 Tax=Dichomitus squalens (strain LYAD-421) TaxID=732165 RepID=UPI00044126F3|nr:uncharacterized protein DICSQDRAFT_152538 [Dichomitus squalens LYAD-421 SS1]EJF65312.1 hypothetical protein DICSQDRAFT_152538 [Dichomitus squalens LYAD-421 SS1]
MCAICYGTSTGSSQQMRDGVRDRGSIEEALKQHSSNPWPIDAVLEVLDDWARWLHHAVFGMALAVQLNGRMWISRSGDGSQRNLHSEGLRTVSGNTRLQTVVERLLRSTTHRVRKNVICGEMVVWERVMIE